MNSDHILYMRLREYAADPAFVFALTRQGSDPHFYALAPVLTIHEVEQAEQTLGFPLPGILREIYLTIGNGNFGPGHGLPSLDELVQGYQQLRHPYDPQRDAHLWGSVPAWRVAGWPEGWLPLCDWGCGMFSFGDVTTSDVPVFFCSPESGDAGTFDEILRQEASSLQEWLETWLDLTTEQILDPKEPEERFWNGHLGCFAPQFLMNARYNPTVHDGKAPPEVERAEKIGQASKPHEAVYRYTDADYYRDQDYPIGE